MRDKKNKVVSPCFYFDMQTYKKLDFLAKQLQVSRSMMIEILVKDYKNETENAPKKIHTK